jgi:putative aldouronate transport system substrate-binding protein
MRRILMKRLLATALSLVLALGLFAGCRSGASKDVTVTVLFHGSSVAEDKAVVDAANARLKELGTGVIFKPIWGTWGDFDTKATTALDTSDSTVDVMFTCSWSSNNYVAYSKSGHYVRLDDPENNLLEKYGTGMKAAVPQSLWDGFSTSGTKGVGIYGVPGYKDYSQVYAWDVNNTRLAELGIEFESINWDLGGEVFYTPEFENALKAAKDKYGPSFYPLIFEAEPLARHINTFDADSIGLLYYDYDADDPSKPEKPTIVARYDTPEYERYLNKIYEFYQAGYIDAAMSNSQQAGDARTAALQAGNYLIGSQTYSYGYDLQASAERGIDARFPQIGKGIVSTGSVQGAGYAISSFSKNPDAAMKFLNAWYTDQTLATIMAYGLEGTHYTKNADGTVTFIKEQRENYAPWRNGMGNIFILPPEDVTGPAYFEEFKAYNEAGVATALVGFTFDPEPVRNQVAALASVRDEYLFSLNTGTVDPAVALPEFRAKLAANGLNEVVAETNRQLEAFFASK